MLDPGLLCNRHLAGEHGELHKHLHNWRKRHKIDGRIAVNSIEPLSYASRHEALEAEMRRRGMKAGSPLEQPDFSYLPVAQQKAKVDQAMALELLLSRCPECRRMFGVQEDAMDFKSRDSLNDNGQCVQCGYCCRVCACAFGTWDEAAGKCRFLAEDDSCSRHDEIVELEKDYIFPMMGSGCSSVLFNERRDAKLRELARKGVGSML